MKINTVEIVSGECKFVKLNLLKLPSATEIDIVENVYRSIKLDPTILVLGGIHENEING